MCVYKNEDIYFDLHPQNFKDRPGYILTIDVCWSLKLSEIPVMLTCTFPVTACDSGISRAYIELSGKTGLENVH